MIHKIRNSDYSDYKLQQDHLCYPASHRKILSFCRLVLHDHLLLCIVLSSLVQG